jgi:MFS family permease
VSVPAWRSRGFSRLWTASTVSVFGSMLSALALPWVAILVLHATPLEVAFLGCADLLAGMSVGLVAGAWVDRLRRRPILVLADLVRALLLASVPLAAALGVLGLAQLFVVGFGMGALSTLFDVASHSFLPSLVPEVALADANGRLSAGAAVAETGGFAASGWLVSLVSAPLALLVDSASYLFSAFCIARIETPETRRSSVSRASGVRAEMRDGLRVVWREPRLRALGAVLGCLRLASGLLGAVYLLRFTRELAVGTGLLGTIVAVGGLGSLLGAVAAPRLARRSGAGAALCIGIAGTVAGVALLPMVTSPGVVGIALLVAHQLIADSSETVFQVNQVSLRQRLAPPAALGRVNASLHVIGLAAALGGRILGGAIGQWYGLRATLVAAAAVAAVAALVSYASPLRCASLPLSDAPAGNPPPDP